MTKVSFKVLDNLGQELVDAGLVSADQLAVAKETQKNLGGDLGHILIKKGFVNEDQVLEFLSKRINIPFVSLKNYAIDPEVIKFVPLSLAKKYHLMPLFKIEDSLTIAMADPLDIFAVDEISGVLKCRVQPVLASSGEIDTLLNESYNLGVVATAKGEQVQVVQYGAEVFDESGERLKEMASGTKVVLEVNKILVSSLREGASDIHVEPQASALKVRYRVDGLLEERIVLPKQMHLPIVTRIKIMADMDIAERRVPQDGRIRVKIEGKLVDLRISSYPTMHGEKVVIRLLSKDQLISLESLGFTEDERKLFEDMIAKPHGILLVSGPTGSGKTTTLYSALQKINSQERNIVSIEDPIENEIAGVNQAQVNLKAGMTFASALRSILRQDPDVIMIGEIRDRETADIAVRAAITGHLVFSTIHTNTAVGSVTRLVDLGVEPFMVASALLGVMSQRLVRKVCKECAVEEPTTDAKRIGLGIEANAKILKGRGCKFCRMSGYSGRLGIFELVPLTSEMRSKIVRGATEDELTEYARKQGIMSLRDEGRQRVLEGLTTVDEILKATEDRS